jgi:hypothetical protein
MEQGDNEFYDRMMKMLHEYRPRDVEIMVSGRHEFVWGTGIRANYLEDSLDRYQILGDNLYGQLLLDLFYEIYRDTLPLDSVRMAQEIIFRPNRTPKFALIMGDSQVNELKKMLCADIIQVSGGKYDELVVVFRNRGYDIRDYQVIIIVCGFNVGKHHSETLWYHCWIPLRDFLETAPSRTKIIMNSPLPSLVKNTVYSLHQHNRFMKYEIGRVFHPGLVYLDWIDLDEGDQSFYDFSRKGRYLNLSLYKDEELHVNHWGLRTLWNRWCAHVPELIPFTHSFRPLPPPEDKNKLPGEPPKKTKLPSQVNVVFNF